MKLYIGVDLGGTNIGAGVVDEKGNIFIKDEVPTGATRPYKDIIADMAGLIESILKQGGYKISDVESIGIGSPGCIDKDQGKVVFANNLNWRHVPVREELQKHIDLPVYIENDANVAGLAEAISGACKGVENSVTITLGTGVGSGIIIGGRPYSGSHGVGAELGHMIVKVGGILCTCGNRGCFERYASATALIREGKEAAKANPDSLIGKSVDGDLDRIDAKVVVDAAKAGDKTALEVFDNYIYYLTMGIVTIINTFDPSIIAIGGGVSRAGDFLLDALKKKVEEHVFYKDMPYADIRLSELGNDAGIVGAAMLGRLK
ncbi:MAG TPA: ROK family protein [Clostridiales bacterium]|nr:ROK family protein [Clostridiales bacterium]